ncbi:hypothetical protein ASE01_14780 [Nocardioides sp. Root190]|uniref:hypothetical protein n=1 Tax=Nocardioides sp. Root190 TaxID=1736488 RepID=UPI0006FEA66B|nr:hypothetical protein [Nocardioides sp. Root190]KRB76267.1 hypothetical protein ASE01_14780 [Nocardioides sp. Root190]
MTDFGSPYSPPPPPTRSDEAARYDQSNQHDQSGQIGQFGQSGQPAPDGGRVVRKSMIGRHVMGVLFALVAAPVGVLVFDYGSGEYLRERIVNFDQTGAVGEILLMFLGAAILMTVALSARLSGLGPILAGLVWGVVPMVWFMADFASFAKFSRDLPSSHFWFSSPPVLFPLVAALLIGAGLAGRWRGRVVPAPSWQ